jgi:hypothetical protein
MKDKHYIYSLHLKKPLEAQIRTLAAKRRWSIHTTIIDAIEKEIAESEKYLQHHN